MKTIRKYPLAPLTEVAVPAGATVLSVQMQAGAPVMWVLLDPADEPVARRFACIGTGAKIEDEVAAHLEFVATFQAGPAVYHVFELRLPQATAADGVVN